MIIETWWSTVAPGKAAIAEDLYRQAAQVVNRKYPGINTRVLRPTTGIMNRIGFISEFESVAARDEVYARTYADDEVTALREKMHDIKAHILEDDAEKHYFDVIG